jgi:hypothetical protein
MSNFPSIEEFDSGQVTATKLEDASDDMDLFHSAQDDFLAREQAVLGDDAQFFQYPPPAPGEAAFFAGDNQGPLPPLPISPFKVSDVSDEDVHEFETSFPPIGSTVLSNLHFCGLGLTEDRLDLGIRLLHLCHRRLFQDKMNLKSSSTVLMSLDDGNG